MRNWDLDYMVIDMHTHMGLEYCLYYPDHEADKMVKAMDEAGIEFIVSAPCEDLFDGSSKRTQITEAMKRHPKRIRGYYCVNPLLGVDVEEIERTFEENPGYAGLKLLPDYHRTNLNSEVYEPVFQLANRKKMLVLSHTWGISMNGESCNSADKIADILEKYPDITFLMGHSIQGQTDEAIEIANTFPNAYLDLCDTCRLNGMVEKMVRRAGSEKVVFGTDAPMQGYCFQMGAVIGARISEEEKRNILRENALRILRSVGRSRE